MIFLGFSDESKVLRSDEMPKVVICRGAAFALGLQIPKLRRYLMWNPSF